VKVQSLNLRFSLSERIYTFRINSVPVPSRHPLEPLPGGLVEPGPWHYRADYLSVYFRADKGRLQQVLPRGLAVGDGTCLAYVCKIRSSSEGGLPQNQSDPGLTVYGEAAYGVGCSFEGKTGIFFPVMWVDKAWSLARGWLNGYSKNYADVIQMSGEGNSWSGNATSGGTTVLSIETVTENRGDKSDLLNFGATFGRRRFPKTDESQSEVDELVEIVKASGGISDVRTGSGRLQLDPREGLGDLEVVCGLAYKSEFTISGAKVLRPTTW
jgi:hypothetical protein